MDFEVKQITPVISVEKKNVLIVIDVLPFVLPKCVMMVLEIT